MAAAVFQRAGGSAGVSAVLASPLAVLCFTSWRARTRYWAVAVLVLGASVWLGQRAAESDANGALVYLWLWPLQLLGASVLAHPRFGGRDELSA